MLQTARVSDGAPAGAAGVNPEFVALLDQKYREGDKQMAPVNVLRAFYAEDLRVLRWLCASEWVEAGYCTAVEARTQYEF